MRTYLSYGGGVNSTAMILALADEGVKFGQDGCEIVYVDHGCDWPETGEYVRMMAERFPITILKPSVGGFDNLYDHCWKYKVIPSRIRRWCTDKFKVRVLLNHFQVPGFSLIGISAEEAHRAKMNGGTGMENRFPLLEREIDRDGCLDIIKAHGLPLPMKSGCWFCPYQRPSQWRKLRREHPELFCKARTLETSACEYRVERGKTPYYLCGDRPLDTVVNESQMTLFAEQAYPPCSCGL